MCIMMIILFATVLVLLWKNYWIKKEAKLFAEKVEDALDAIEETEKSEGDGRIML